MSLSLIIFDCDGVILESVDAKTRAFHRIGLEYGEEVADRLSLYHSLNGGINRMQKFEWLFTEVLNKPFTDADKERLNSLFVDYCYDEIAKCQLVPGITDVLNHWHGKVPLYVASGAPHQELQLILKLRNLNHYFTGIYGAPPAKTQLLRNILQETNIHPNQTVMIGDSRTDQVAAEAVQCHFYGRGEYFKHSGYPWHEDLTKLNEYLTMLSQEL